MYAGPVNQTPSVPPADAFALKLNPAGSGVIWGSYLGGSGVEVANSLAVDASHEVWLAGTTASPEFPNTQGWSQGSDFVAGFDSSGSKLVYAARYPNDGTSRTLAVDTNGLLHVAGPTGIVSTIAPGGPPLTRVFGIANAANGPLDGRAAAGEVISIYGPHIGPANPIVTVADGSGNLPTSVPGYQVTIGVPLPLLYLSDSLINAVVPFGYAGGPLHVITPNSTTPDFMLTAVPAAPEIFRNPDNSAIAINEDGTRNATDNPALLGSYVSIWTTGSGVFAGGSAGQIATTANNYYCCGIELGRGTAPVVYAGTAPGAALGVSQVNFQVPVIPQFSNPSSLPLRIIAPDGSLSRPVTLYVRY